MNIDKASATYFRKKKLCLLMHIFRKLYEHIGCTVRHKDKGGVSPASRDYK